MIYYNENNKFAANWLEKLMQAQLIPQGVVDRRSITEIKPDDLKQYTQCHFFAGIGGWSYALELARWDINKPVWTGSCPCQPFSAAGNKKGFNDDRDLWPVWFKLIQKCKPSTIFGEQVEPAIKHGWLDRLSNDLEAEDYSVGSAVLPACSIGAPHQRKRLWWVANSDRYDDADQFERGSCKTHGVEIITGDKSLQLWNLGRTGEGVTYIGVDNPYSQSRRGGETHELRSSSEVSIMADADSKRLQRRSSKLRETRESVGAVRRSNRAREWREAEYIKCTDGKFRPIEPSVRLLVDGFPSRMGLLRGFGNAIVPQVASVFIKSFMEISV